MRGNVVIGLALILVGCGGTATGSLEEATATTDVTSTPAVSPTSDSTPMPTSTPTPETPEVTTLPEPEPVDPTTIHGMWRSPGTSVSSSVVFMRFDDAGEWQAAYTVDGGAFDFGTYEFDGRALVMYSSPEVRQSPCAGLTGTYPTAFADGGEEFRLLLAGAKDPCGKRLPDITSRTFTRAAP